MLAVDVERQLGAFRLEANFVAPRGVVAVFGRSGAGKTSLVNAIAGLDRPDRGSIALDEKVLFDSARGIDVPVARRRVGYVFQEGRLFPHLTVRQNLLYGRWFSRSVPRSVSVERIVELLGLGHLLTRRPAALSGGEKQRVAIGRALLASPQLLLLDEPLASLDTHRKAEILRYIELMRDEIDLPIVYVSHAVEEVVRLADTVVVMAEGKVVAAGAVEEVMGRPDLRPLSAPFEGGAVIDAKVISHDLDYDLTRLAFAGGSLTVPGMDALIGEPVRVRVRARDVSIALSPPVDISITNVLPAQVLRFTPATEGIVEADLDLGGTLLRARITRRSKDTLHLTAGQRVYALVKAITLDQN
jgi:molybdate transport system ATP-binding protein